MVLLDEASKGLALAKSVDRILTQASWNYDAGSKWRSSSKIYFITAGVAYGLEGEEGEKETMSHLKSYRYA